MQLGVQIPDFTSPGGPARLGADLATVARRGASIAGPRRAAGCAPDDVPLASHVLRARLGRVGSPWSRLAG